MHQQRIKSTRYDRPLSCGWSSVLMFTLEFILLDFDASLLTSERPQSFWRGCQLAGCFPV